MGQEDLDCDGGRPSPSTQVQPVAPDSGLHQDHLGACSQCRLLGPALTDPDLGALEGGPGIHVLTRAANQP